MEECNETGMVIVLKNAITRQMIFGTSRPETTWWIQA
jgi:hypothetical protein